MILAVTFSGPRFKDSSEWKKKKAREVTIQTAQNFKDSELGALVRKERGFQVVNGGVRGRRWNE